MTSTLSFAGGLSNEGGCWRGDLDPPLRSGWIAYPKIKIKSLLCAARSESLLFACPKRSNQEKGHPGFPAPRMERARGTLRCSESVGRRELGHPWPRTCAPFPAEFFRYSAENKRGFRANSQKPASFRAAASLAPLTSGWHRCARHQLTEAGAAVAPVVALGSLGPHRLVPSSGARAGGKARMFEHMDVRVRAGPVMASSAGDRAGLFPRGARLGCPSLWLLSLGQARESDSLPAGRESS